jgi:hypothetical protein
MFSKKATKIEKIFIVDLTLTLKSSAADSSLCNNGHEPL